MSETGFVLRLSLTTLCQLPKFENVTDLRNENH
jgi:hypothetical protein